MKKSTIIITGLLLSCMISIIPCQAESENGSFNGLDMNLGTLPRLSDAKTR